MIATLLRRDAVLASVGWSTLVAVFIAWLLTVTVLDTVAELDVTLTDTGAQPAGGGLTSWLGLLLHLEVLGLVFALSAGFAGTRDGTGPFAIARPLDHGLPVAPRQAWLARLLALVVALVLPLGAAWAVIAWTRGQDEAAALGRIACLGASVILAGLATVGDDGGRHLRGHLAVVATLLAAATALAADLGAFRPEDAPPRQGFGWMGPGLLLLTAGLAAHRWWCLPAGWSLVTTGGLRSGRKARSAERPEPSAAPALRGSDGRVLRSCLWSGIVLSWAALDIALLPLVASLDRPLALVLFPVMTLAMTPLALTSRLRLLDPLPVARRRLLLIGLVPVLVGVLVGGGLALGLEALRHPLRPLVTVEDQVRERTPAPADPLQRYESWVDVVVPRGRWQVAWDGEAPLLTTAEGGTIRPRIHRILGLVPVYNPFDAPPGTSEAGVAWQWSRALEAEHGVRLDPALLADQYLETEVDGEVDIDWRHTARENDARDQDLIPYYHGVGTLVLDHPELARPWDSRQLALLLLVIAVLTAGGSSLALRLRPGTRAARWFRGLLATIFLVAYLGDQVLELWLGPAHPQVLFSIAGQALLDLVPFGAAGVWTLTALVLWGSWSVLARAFERTEAVTSTWGAPRRTQA